MLDSELEDLLRKNLELAKDNNRMLHGMRRRAFWGGLLRLVFWFLVLFGFPLFAYYFYLQPYLMGLQEAYGSAKDGLVQFGSFSEQFKEFFGMFGSGE